MEVACLHCRAWLEDMLQRGSMRTRLHLRGFRNLKGRWDDESGCGCLLNLHRKPWRDVKRPTRISISSWSEWEVCFTFACMLSWQRYNYTPTSCKPEGNIEVMGNSTAAEVERKCCATFVDLYVNLGLQMRGFSVQYPHLSRASHFRKVVLSTLAVKRQELALLLILHSGKIILPLPISTDSGVFKGFESF